MIPGAWLADPAWVAAEVSATAEFWGTTDRPVLTALWWYGTAMVVAEPLVAAAAGDDVGGGNVVVVGSGAAAGDDAVAGKGAAEVAAAPVSAAAAVRLPRPGELRLTRQPPGYGRAVVHRDPEVPSSGAAVSARLPVSSWSAVIAAVAAAARPAHPRPAPWRALFTDALAARHALRPGMGRGALDRLTVELGLPPAGGVGGRAGRRISCCLLYRVPGPTCAACPRAPGIPGDTGSGAAAGPRYPDRVVG